MSDSVKYDQRYVENEDFVPNPADMRAQYDTTGYGGGINQAAAPAVALDKVHVAQQVVDALDEDNEEVSESAVLVPADAEDPEAAKEDLKERAQRTLDKGVVVGGLTPEQEKAAEEDKDAAKSAESEKAESKAAESKKPAKKASSSK